MILILSPLNLLYVEYVRQARSLCPLNHQPLKQPHPQMHSASAAIHHTPLDRPTINNDSTGQLVHAVDDDLEPLSPGLVTPLGLAAQFEARR